MGRRRTPTNRVEFCLSGEGDGMGNELNRCRFENSKSRDTCRLLVHTGMPAVTNHRMGSACQWSLCHKHPIALSTKQKASGLQEQASPSYQQLRVI
jgi:hypothetical protein